MTEAFDNQGNPLTFHQIFTYCEAGEVDRARLYALEFMTRPNRNSGMTSPEQTLNLPLRPVGGEAVTHYGCIRDAWSNEVAEQQEFHTTTTEAPSFQMLVCCLQEALEHLGMEVME